MEKVIKIFDTTLRDGEQAPGFSMNLDEKVRMALQLEKLNVDIIEGGFPIASDGDFNAVKEIAGRIRNCSVAGLCRTKLMDIDRAWEALKYAKKPRIHTFIATSDMHLKYKLNKTRDEILKDVFEAVQYASNYCEDVEFSAEDASRSDKYYLCEVFSAAIEAGASTINVPDTVGYSVPWEFGELIKFVQENTPKIERITLSVHCHNDLGLAVANSLSAVNNGVRQVECTINSIGERAGNTSLEEIVMALKTKHEFFNVDTMINTRELFPSSQLLTEITGVPVQPNKAIVGKNAFAHEAGIHQDGVLKNPMTYEIMTPHSVGVPTNTLVIGKHSGRHAIDAKLKELGFNFDKEMINSIYKKIMELADSKKKIEEEDILNIASQYVIEEESKLKINQ
ncbi:MAG: 2-isopropylmalate synthase [bacterium]|nr:2-isopropylmalate synthase [bacterium]